MENGVSITFEFVITKMDIYDELSKMFHRDHEIHYNLQQRNGVLHEYLKTHDDMEIVMKLQHLIHERNYSRSPPLAIYLTKHHEPKLEIVKLLCNTEILNMHNSQRQTPLVYYLLRGGDNKLIVKYMLEHSQGLKYNLRVHLPYIHRYRKELAYTFQLPRGINIDCEYYRAYCAGTLNICDPTLNAPLKRVAQALILSYKIVMQQKPIKYLINEILQYVFADL
jgi:hypothetical protein